VNLQNKDGLEKSVKFWPDEKWREGVNEETESKRQNKGNAPRSDIRIHANNDSESRERNETPDMKR
jgi:hypothetical protein